MNSAMDREDPLCLTFEQLLSSHLNRLYSEILVSATQLHREQVNRSIIYSFNMSILFIGQFSGTI